MSQNYLYEFWSPEGDYRKVRATPEEARRYDITGSMLMEVACDCYHEHYMEYSNVADVLRKCYYTKTLITDEACCKKIKIVLGLQVILLMENIALGLLPMGLIVQNNLNME